MHAPSSMYSAKTVTASWRKSWGKCKTGKTVFHIWKQCLLVMKALQNKTYETSCFIMKQFENTQRVWQNSMRWDKTAGRQDSGRKAISISPDIPIDRDVEIQQLYYILWCMTGIWQMPVVKCASDICEKIAGAYIEKEAMRPEERMIVYVLLSGWNEIFFIGS